MIAIGWTLSEETRCVSCLRRRSAKRTMRSLWPWAVGRGPWAVGRGPWAVGRGPWAVGRGPWAVGRGPWAVAMSGIYFRVHSKTATFVIVTLRGRRDDLAAEGSLQRCSATEHRLPVSASGRPSPLLSCRTRCCGPFPLRLRFFVDLAAPFMKGWSCSRESVTFFLV